MLQIRQIPELLQVVVVQSSEFDLELLELLHERRTDLLQRVEPLLIPVELRFPPLDSRVQVQLRVLQR